jgi:predicted phosphodiesterase
MLIAIVADLHANLEATEAVFKDIDAVGPDQVVCLGDLAGYNANPNEVVDFVRAREIPCVMGNHDAAAAGLEDPWFFRSGARRAIEWHREQLRDDNRQWLTGHEEQLHFSDFVLGVHGAPGNRDDYIVDWLDAMRQLEYLNGHVSVCFFGHSHRPSFFPEKGKTTGGAPSGTMSLSPINRYLINPGAVGQPRDRDPRAAYGLFDTDKREVTFKRVEYDIDSTMRKILDAGLPEELARRLTQGK